MEALSDDDASLLELLRRFLSIQHRRASIYSRLNSAFQDYLQTGAEAAYQQVCSQITTEFSDCSKQVLKLEVLFRSPKHDREDLANLLQSVQVQEKQKLHMTAQIQVLKRAGRPSERVVTHDQCRFEGRNHQHHCIHVREISVADGLEDAEAEFEYNAALSEAVKGVQDAVSAINEYIEEVRYEIDDLQASQSK
ncbi:hypothetical protein KP509_26G049300 [Ceratopteris richardii]|uniref:Uncharacterized protein n=1 Tax=Ceratopteris richardii TaxID=49495 RepID=A0A8T2RN58_CERRI|nr:hypothetical protein KP509_26G049300 [Ceratopteris richardii]